MGISNQAHIGGGACVANGGRYGAIDYSTLDLGFYERFGTACAFLFGVFFLLACISGSAPETTAPVSAVFFGVVSGELKRDSVYWRIGYVINSFWFWRGCGGL